MKELLLQGLQILLMSEVSVTSCSALHKFWSHIFGIFGVK